MYKALGIAAGVAALGTLAYFYDSWQKRSKQKYTEFDRKIKALKTIKDPKGSFVASSIVKLIEYVSEESEKSFESATEHLIKRRRKQLKDEEYDEYLETAQDCLDLQRDIEDEYLRRGLSKLGVEMEEYEGALASLPRETLQSIMAKKAKMDQLKPDAAVPVSRMPDRERTKRIFMESEEGVQEKCKELIEKLRVLSTTLDPSIANYVTMGISQFITGDVLYNEYKVTEEELSAAINHYRIMEDPDVIRMQNQKAMLYNALMAQAQAQGQYPYLDAEEEGA